MTTTRTEIMAIALSAALGGTVFGYMLCHETAKAGDPCDKESGSYRSYEPPQRYDNGDGMHKSYDEHGNAVWTLHPR